MNREEFSEKVIERVDTAFVEESASALCDAAKGAKPRVKMKRILLIAASVLFACLLGGTVFLIARNNLQGKKHTFSVTVVGTTNGGTASMDLTNVGTLSWFQSKDAPAELTVTFMGKSYTGTYFNSERSSLRDDWSNHYHVKDGSMCTGFEVSGLTGKLTMISLGGYRCAALAADQTKTAISIDMIREKALSYAEEWLPLDDYSEKYEKRTAGEPYYFFTYNWTFVRKVQGIETTDEISLRITDRGTLLLMSTNQPGWTKDHQAELDAFPLEEAIKHAKSASGLTNPTVDSCRFELGRDGYVFLKLVLSGRPDEQSVILSVSVSDPDPDESKTAENERLLLDDVPVERRIFILPYPYEGKDDRVAYLDRIAERIVPEFHLVRISDYPEMNVFAAAMDASLTNEEAHALLEDIAEDPDVLIVSRGARTPNEAIDSISNVVQGPEPVGLNALSGSELPDGWKEYETLEEAETAVGFTLQLPDMDLPKVYRTYEDWLIEVIFVQDGLELYRLRKGKGYGNMSGDATMSASASVSIDNSPMTNVGGPKEEKDSAPFDQYRIAIRRYQAFSYSVTSAKWLTFKEIIQFFEDDPVKSFL